MIYKIEKKNFLDLLKLLFSDNIIEELVSGVENRKRSNIKGKIITVIDDLDDFPLSQLLVYNYGLTDSAANIIRLGKNAQSKKVGVVGHACDIRALVELHKKNQLKWENLFVITFEDIGYIDGKELRSFFRKKKIDETQIIYERLTQKEFILKYENGKVEKYILGKDIKLSRNCSMCTQKEHPLSDFKISTYTLPDDSEEFLITPVSERAHELISKLDWSKNKISDDEEQAYSNLARSIIETCQVTQDNILSEWDEKSFEEKLKIYDKCTGCGMCVRSCPVCICTTCKIQNDYKNKKISNRTFLLTRFAHVGDLCISCGKCESNCPFGIPLTSVFKSMNKKLKERVNYEAGKDTESKQYRMQV